VHLSSLSNLSIEEQVLLKAFRTGIFGHTLNILVVLRVSSGLLLCRPSKHHPFLASIEPWLLDYKCGSIHYRVPNTGHEALFLSSIRSARLAAQRGDVNAEIGRKVRVLVLGNR
jgi:hypothetical protein